MSQFDRENNEVIALVNENHRRSCVCPTIGVIVPVEEAKKIAVQNARAAQDLPSVASVILPIFFLFAVVAVGVVVLA